MTVGRHGRKRGVLTLLVTRSDLRDGSVTLPCPSRESPSTPLIPRPFPGAQLRGPIPSGRQLERAAPLPNGAKGPSTSGCFGAMLMACRSQPLNPYLPKRSACALRVLSHVYPHPRGRGDAARRTRSLRQRLDGEFTERLREANGFGRSYENDEYLQIKEEEAVLASRIRQLESLLDSADHRRGVRGPWGRGDRIGRRRQEPDSGKVGTHRITGGSSPPSRATCRPTRRSARPCWAHAGGDGRGRVPTGRTVTLEVMAVEASAPMARPARA